MLTAEPRLLFHANQALDALGRMQFSDENPAPDPWLGATVQVHLEPEAVDCIHRLFRLSAELCFPNVGLDLFRFQAPDRITLINTPVTAQDSAVNLEFLNRIRRTFCVYLLHLTMGWEEEKDSAQEETVLFKKPLFSSGGMHALNAVTLLARLSLCDSLVIRYVLVSNKTHRKPFITIRGTPEQINSFIAPETRPAFPSETAVGEEMRDHARDETEELTLRAKIHFQEI